ncbi:MAG: Fe-S protein assembly co-chaperone HscB [Saprospiraceae bacterium]
MQYFELYDLPVSFLLDGKLLKRKFYKLSKQFHPDFYTLESEEKQAEILELSTVNNEAYKTLSDFDKRMEYILKEKSVYGEEGKNKVPQDFLMEMMEVNEALMELEFDFDSSILETTKQNIKNMEEELYNEILPILKNYNEANTSTTNLEQIKDFHFKRKYLLRIQNNLSKFAAL